LREQLKQFQPTLVLVSLGTNDAENLGQDDETRKKKIAAEEQRMLALLDTLRAAGCEVVWIGPPQLPFRSDDEEAMLKKHVAPSNYFPSSDIAISRTHNNTGEHAVPKSMDVWTAALWQWLQS
jgi:hypothetical protein